MLRKFGRFKRLEVDHLVANSVTSPQQTVTEPRVATVSTTSTVNGADYDVIVVNKHNITITIDSTGMDQGDRLTIKAGDGLIDNNASAVLDIQPVVTTSQTIDAYNAGNGGLRLNGLSFYAEIVCVAPMTSGFFMSVYNNPVESINV